MAKKTRIRLMNGCSVSTPSVFPPNWKDGGVELLQTDWRIQYYFHDPEHAERWPKGKLCVVKGMNIYNSLESRRAYTIAAMDSIFETLNAGWNPITKTHMVDSSIDFATLNPNLPFINAFNLALKKLTCTERHRNEVKLVVERLQKAAIKLKMQNITIENLKRRELKKVLQAVGFTPNYFNHARAYISSLFVELIDEDCCDVNLVRDIRKQQTITETREVLSDKKLETVMEHLKATNYNFWRYARIFMFSGSRTSELFRVKRCDVDLDEQEFTVLIKKGKQYKKVTKVILNEVLDLWKEVCEGAGPEDYVFSTGLRNGPKMIRPDQIRRRWMLHVKKPLGVTADFYALKHKMLDMVDEDTAMKLASHTNLKTTSIYRVNKEKRDREELKKLRVVS